MKYTSFKIQVNIGEASEVLKALAKLGIDLQYYLSRKSMFSEHTVWLFNDSHHGLTYSKQRETFDRHPEMETITLNDLLKKELYEIY